MIAGENKTGKTVRDGRAGKSTRSTRKMLRLTAAEESDLEIASQRWGMNVSEVLRRCFKVVAGRGFLDIEGNIEARLAKIERELKMQGTNINQLAVVTHKSKNPPPYLEASIQRFTDKLDSVEQQVAEITVWMDRNAQVMREEI